MTDAQIVWLFVLAVALHNLEEAIGLPRFAATLWRAPSAGNFRFGVTVLTALIAMVAWWALACGPGSIPAYLLAGTALAMLVNVIVPHLAGTLVLRRYLPGLATAMLLIAPAGGLLLHRWIDQGWIDRGVFVWAGPLTVLGIVALVAALFAIGARLFPIKQTPEA